MLRVRSVFPCFVHDVTSRHFSSENTREPSRMPSSLAADALKRVTKIGAAANFALGIFKASAGCLVGSAGLIADAANSFSDILTDSVVYYAITKSRCGATDANPWGSGKLESLGTLAVGGILISTAVGIGYSALSSGIDIAAAQASLKTDTHQTVQGVSVNSLMNMEPEMAAALVVACGSALSKECLFRSTLHIGQSSNSSVVVANAWHHRSDAFVSSAVFVGLVGSAAGFPLLDPLAGVLVAGVISHSGINCILDAIKDLRDSPASSEETQALKDTCMSVAGVLSVEKLVARLSGPYLYVECTVGVPGKISASAAHRVAELVREALLESHPDRVAEVIVHVDPIGSTGLGKNLPEWARSHNDIAARATEAVMGVDGIVGVSEVQVYYRDNGSIGVKVDVLMRNNVTIGQAHDIAKLARKAVEQSYDSEEHHIDIDMELNDR
eukprot:CAMPEP_0185039712 /NCGR_PEP_ID=MMETSP1103-20130426/36860_1 /TAXON_ID=36769 /ORGANISM="Paraphysomonas bandaiensis, Strain Caron Lab Isolate" /LENGTH=441 /DNA_ID=CAMNT_0027578717 /DNA_START=157 /DNA_END=1482 /DNA_ORIENTATION=+